MERMIQVRAVINGNAEGRTLVSKEPLSFWGGYDWKTGEIIDRRHPLSGQIAAHRILCVPFARGSSTTTAVLLEAIHNKTAPAAIVTTDTDFFFALASVVAGVMYDLTIPLFAMHKADFDSLSSEYFMRIKDGKIYLRS